MRYRPSVKKFRPLSYIKWDLIIVLIGIFGAVWYAWHQFFLAHSSLVSAKGGIYTESLIGTTNNLSPFSESATLFDRDLRKLIFAGLLRYDPISGEIESGLADLRISEEGKTYFLTLKDSARFQDGELVTTSDVIFTFEKLIQNPNFPNRTLYETFEYVTIDVVDERTLAFHIPERNVFFSTFLTVPILPGKYFQNVLIEEVIDPDFPFNKNPIGAGPFRFERLVPNDDGSFRVFLKPNPYFYAGEPNLESVVFYVYPSFEHLKFSKSWSTVFSQVPFRETRDFESEFFGEYAVREYVMPRFVGLFFNLDRPSVKELYFRKAIGMSIDKEKIIEKEKEWIVVHSPFFFEGIEGWHETDFEAGIKLMKENGFIYEEEIGNRTNGKGGDPLDLKMITSTSPPVYSRFAQKIIKTWEEELKLKVKLDILPPKEFREALQLREYDMVLFGQDFSENFDALSLWHSSQSGKLNFSNLTRDDMDFLIDEIRFSGAQSDLVALNDRLLDLVPAVIFSTPKYNLLVSNRLQGFSETFGKIRSHADRFIGIEDWYFKQALDWDWEDDEWKILGFFRWIFE